MTTADVRDARRIFIVGAGGFGREVLAWARNAWPEASAKVAGFLAEERGLRGHGSQRVYIQKGPECVSSHWNIEINYNLIRSQFK